MLEIELGLAIGNMSKSPLPSLQDPQEQNVQDLHGPTRQPNHPPAQWVQLPFLEEGQARSSGLEDRAAQLPEEYRFYLRDRRNSGS